MIKSELTANIAAKKTDIPEATINKSVNYILEKITCSLVDNQRVEIRGFGSFCLHEQAARLAHNPKTGEKIQTKDKKKPHFKPGKDLRENVDASKAKFKIKEE